MAVRDVMLAIFAEIFSVGVDDGGGVEVDAGHLLFVDRDDDHHVVLLGDLLHQLGGGAVGDALGQFVPAGVLLGAEIRAVEKFLQAEDLRFLLRGLLDQLEVLVDHGLANLRQRTIGGNGVAGLNQGAADIAGHGSPPGVDCKGRNYSRIENALRNRRGETPELRSPDSSVRLLAIVF